VHVADREQPGWAALVRAGDLARQDSSLLLLDGERARANATRSPVWMARVRIARFRDDVAFEADTRGLYRLAGWGAYDIGRIDFDRMKAM
jgi:hypothetical protein